MKKVVLVLLCAFCVSTYAYNEFSETVKNLKNYGLGFCLKKVMQEEIRKR